MLVEYRLKGFKKRHKVADVTIRNVKSLGFGQFDYIINDKIYTRSTDTFREEYNKIRMWLKLKG